MNRNYPNPPNMGSNPFGNYNPLTTNNNIFSRQNNFNQAFLPNSTVLEKTDFRNKGEVLHNNLGDNLLLEQLTEYYINIDSKDRTVEVFTNPFNFYITFGGIGKSIERWGKDKTEKKAFNGTPSPVIERSFQNVKFIKLDNVILPNSIAITRTSDAVCEISQDPTYDLTKYKYLLIRIKELCCDKIFSTNPVQGDSTFLLYPDKVMGENHTMWLSTFSVRLFQTSKLFNLTKLTIEIIDPLGNPIYVYDADTNKVINFATIDDDFPEDEAACIKELSSKFQMNLSFIVGVIENELNTNISYNQ